MKTAQSGFTLIELLITVTAIGILTAIALPVYQNYTKRTYIAEGLSLVGSAKAAVTEYYSSEGRWPANNLEASLADAETITSEAVKRVAVQPNGAIRISFNEKVKDNGYLILVPDMGGNSIIWECTPGTLDAVYLPKRCRS